MTAKHDPRLSTTADNDGIWLTCPCGEDFYIENLGFNPTPAEVMVASAGHVSRSFDPAAGLVAQVENARARRALLPEWMRPSAPPLAPLDPSRPSPAIVPLEESTDD